MDWDRVLYDEREKPLDRLVDGYSNTAVFRSIAFVGDSLSSGEFEIRDEHGKPKYFDMYEYSWGQYIARKNGLKAYNFSRGGMTAREYLESFAKDNGFWDREKACQAYVIALGVNDILGRGMEIGTIRDVETMDEEVPYDKPVFLRYYAGIVRRYKEISPGAKFFFVTFPDTTLPGRKEKTVAVREALYALAEYFEDAYMIDLYQYGPVHDEKFMDRFYLYGHMNPSGYILTARIIDSYIDYIVRHNPEDFKTVGLVGVENRKV